MKHSIAEAARIVSVTRKTFYKHIDKKGISVEKDGNDSPVIDASELIRVYGDQCNFEYNKQPAVNGKGTQPSPNVSSEQQGATISESVAVTQKELELVKAQLATERENFEEQIDYLRGKLDDSDSEARKLTALLTDQREREDRAGAWQKSFKSLEARLANQEKAGREYKEERQKILKQNQALKKALTDEKNKTVWNKLFG